jgi:hypothetical protein
MLGGFSFGIRGRVGAVTAATAPTTSLKRLEPQAPWA